MQPSTHITKGFNNSKKLFVVNLVVDLNRCQFTRVITNWVELTIISRLLKNARNGEVRSISRKSTRKRNFEVMKNRVRNKGLFQVIESGVTSVVK